MKKIAFLFLLLCPHVKATSPVITTVLQPANLVGDSVPGCIPLNTAVCYANYGSGIQNMISSSHPFIGGGKEWQRGTESNSNLASVFGIKVKSDYPYGPAEIHLKDWDLPPYSPHTREEVLTATIHCLLLAALPNSDNPLHLKITTANDEDQEWAKSFARKYTLLPGRDGKAVTPTPVGDSFIKTDGFGTQYVISPKLNPRHETPKVAPIFLPLEVNHDGKPAALITFWPGTGSRTLPKGPLQFLDLPRGFFYNLFSSGPQFSIELNPLLTEKNYCMIRSEVKKEVVEVHMTFGGSSLRNATSAIAAAALTTRINHEKPMKVRVNSFENDSPLLEALLKTQGWKEATVGSRPAATTIFDYDPQTKKLTRGTLPDGVILNPTPNQPLHLKRKDG